MSRYTVHPLEKSFQEYDHKHKKQRNNYWRKLRLAKNDYLQNEHQVETIEYGFKCWMRDKWGISIGCDDQGNYSQDFTVVDDRKYIMFMMKYV